MRIRRPAAIFARDRRLHQTIDTRVYDSTLFFQARSAHTATNVYIVEAYVRRRPKFSLSLGMQARDGIAHA